MKIYETLQLVKSEDLNHHGTLFAARSASWLIEIGFATAACVHGDTDEIVLRSLQNMSYYKPVKKGTVVKFTGRVVAAGNTSLTVAVTAKNAITEEMVIEGFLTFVTIDKNSAGKKLHNIVLDEAADEEEKLLRAKAEQLRGR